jgi:C4-dicarboxylate-binding protein DctP
MLAPSLAKFGPLGVKEFEVFDLPFIFDNTAELHKVTQGPVGKQLLASSTAKGIKAGVLDNGFKSFSAKQGAQDARRLQGPERCASSRPRCSRSNARGGRAAAVMAFSEVYQALQTGVGRRHRRTRTRTSTRRRCHEVQKS